MIDRVAFLFVLVFYIAAYSGAQQPNIVLIYGDDVGFGDLGCYGAETIPTPNLDQLAGAGLRFTSGYCTSATCTPSRYSLLTGNYAWRTPGTGIAPPNGAALIKPGTHTLATVLQGAGYRTGVIGKWHLGLGNPPKPDWAGAIKPGPMEIGFESSFILPTTNDRVPCVYVRGHRIVAMSADDPVDVFYKNPDGQPTGITHREQLKMDWTHGHNNSIVNGIGRIGFMTGGHAARWTDETMAGAFVDEAKAFIAKKDDRPFFLFYSAHQIHVPRAPNEQFVGSTPHGPRGDAMVELDWCVGQIVDAIKQKGVLNETLILFTSDNGPVLDDGYKDAAVTRLGNHQPAGPYRGGKYSRFEGGTRVPWIVHWPERVSSGTSPALISQVDFVATLAEIANVDKLPSDAALDSLAIAKTLLGDDTQGRDYIVENSGTSKPLAIRQGNWKYIEPANGPAVNIPTNSELGNHPRPQLYDLANDPGERTNVADQHPRIIDQLAALLDTVKRRNDRLAGALHQ